LHGTTWASLAAVRSLRTGLPVDADDDSVGRAALSASLQ
jgi:hypothetical protein